MSAYSNYYAALQLMLHDSNFAYWTQSELLTYINLARDRVVRDTGSYRVLQTGYISPKNESYAFGSVTGVSLLSSNSSFVTTPNVFLTNATGDTTGSGAQAIAVMSGTTPNLTVASVYILNGGTGYTLPPVVSFDGAGTASAVSGILHQNTFDVVNLTIDWGNTRLVPSYLNWSKFNAQARYYINRTGRTQCWSTYSNNSVYIQPVPDQTYAVEWDTVMQPPPIVNNLTIEVIPFPFQDCVPFYAAYLAKYKDSDVPMQQKFLADYGEQIKAAIRSSFTRRSRNPYA